MFKIVLSIFVVFLTTAVFCAFVADDDDDSHRKPGYCRYHGVDIKEGEWIPADVGHCHEIKCLDPAKNSVGGVGCSLFKLRPGSECHIAEDPTKPFPHCCPKKVCPNDK